MIINDYLISIIHKCAATRKLLNIRSEIPDVLLINDKESEYFYSIEKSAKSLISYFNESIKIWNNFIKDKTPQDFLNNREEFTRMFNIIDSFVRTMYDLEVRLYQNEIMQFQQYFESINGFYYEEKGKKFLTEYNKIYMELLNSLNKQN